MISFASLFVGLVFGIVNVELAVSGGVDHARLLLDGRPVAELRAPWRAPLDLGCVPAPHELAVVAFDPAGREIGRARQWVNRPRPPADASLVVERAEGEARRRARLSWRSLTGELPRSISVTLDDRPVAAPDPARIELPPVDPGRSHTLRATLEFEAGVRAEAETHFGGSLRDQALEELTAVAVEVEKGTELPPAERMAGLLEREGRPVEVSAVEGDGPMDVVFVCEGSAFEPFRRVVKGGGRYLARAEVPEELWFRFLFPVGRMTAQSAMVANTYPITPRLSAADGSFAAQAVARVIWPRWTRDGQRLADAVAVAGLAAAEQERRRAVVLLLGPQAREGGLLAPAEAASLLADLNVPLHVWSVGLKRSDEAGRWPRAVTVSSYGGFRSAVKDLVGGLGRQRILWIEGSWRPQTILPSGLAKGFRRAGSDPRP